MTKGFLRFYFLIPHGIAKGFTDREGWAVTAERFSERRLLIPVMPSGELADFVRVASNTSTRFSAELSSIEERMAELLEKTREVPGWNVCLYIQRRDGRSASLRWRSADGGIVPDTDLLPSLKDYPLALQEWYRFVHANVLWLNASERVCRRLAAEYSALADSVSGVMAGRGAGLPA